MIKSNTFSRFCVTGVVAISILIPFCVLGCKGSSAALDSDDTRSGGATRGDSSAPSGAQSSNPSGLNADKINAEASQEKHPDGK